MALKALDTGTHLTLFYSFTGALTRLFSTFSINMAQVNTHVLRYFTHIGHVRHVYWSHTTPLVW